MATVRYANQSVGESSATVRPPTFVKATPAGVSLRPPTLQAGMSVRPGGAGGETRLFSPALDYVQHFAAAGATPQRFCRDFASIGFSEARWAPSEVFGGEWECSSWLVADGNDQESIFFVMRGAHEGAVRNLMFKLNAVSPMDGVRLIEATYRALDRFSSTFGVLLTPDAYRRLADGKPADMLSSLGRVRIVAEHGGDGRWVVSLTVNKRLPSPVAGPCRNGCRLQIRLPTAARENRGARVAGR